MGLIGNTLDWAGDQVNGAVEAGSEALDNILSPVTGTADAISSTTDSITDTVNNAVDSVSGAEDSTNEAAGDTTESADIVIDEGTEGFFEILRGGVNTVEGFFRALEGIGLSLRDFTWIPEKILGVSVRERIVDFTPDIFVAFLSTIGNLIAGFFGTIAGIFAALSAGVSFLISLNGYEGIGLILGLLLIFLAIYMLVTSFGFQILDSVIIGLTGIGFVWWAAENFFGGLFLLAMGLGLLSVGMLADRASFLVYAIPITALGGWFVTITEFGFLGSFLLTVALMFGVAEVLARIETDISVGLAMQEAKGPGLIEGEKHAKRIGGGLKNLFGQARNVVNG